jgi:exopolysaccharide biosynthesis polyprenyl glycosylphosphotransferase
MRTTTIPRTSFNILDQPERARDIVRLEFRIYQGALVLLDLFLTLLAYRAAYILRFESGAAFFQESIVPQVPLYINAMLLAVPIWMVIFAIQGLYNRKNILGGTREYELLFNSSVLGTLVIISLGFLFPTVILARGWVILTWALAFLFTATGRFVSRRIVYSMRKTGHFQEPALIIGANEEGQLLADQLNNWQTAGVRVVGYLDDEHCCTLSSHLQWLGKLDELDHVVSKNGIGEIILVTSALTREQVLALFRKYGTRKDINLRLTSGLYEIISTGMQIREDGLVPMMSVNKVRMTGWDRVMKLMLDYVIAVPLSIALLPVFGIIMLLIKLDSAGPAIYRRRVMGVNGHEFDAFKFRTMRIDGDEILANNPELMKEYLENYKLKVDPRITRIGNFLRKTSLDELPQIFNVLRNEMSLVGPRMISPQELSKYDQWDINLLTVKPGITGMWQVHGRSEVSYEERVRMDMLYIRNWTIWLDIQLLIQTIPAVLSRKGAY